MLRSELNYELPDELIAHEPIPRRDAGRLLVLDRKTGLTRHEHFAHLPDLLPARAVLIFNDTRVLPARLQLVRPTGGRLEGLFLREVEPGTWEMMLTGAGRVKKGEALSIAGSSQTLVMVQRRDAGTWQVRVDPSGAAIDILGRHGSPPLPPYILRRREEALRDQQSVVSSSPDGSSEVGESQSEINSLAAAEPSEAGQFAIRNPQWTDTERYQTVYARAPGAVAAPTAGLHFTPELLDVLRQRGHETHFVTLHVGPGTFAPIRADDLADHEMHAEWYACPQSVADAVNTARSEGRPIVAVGTTSVRVLETCAIPFPNERELRDSKSRGLQPARPLERDERSATQSIRPGSGWTRLFIYPPYEFKTVDAMITNFHLPESTLLAMVFAFAGRERVLAAYQEAICERYRFYSYGDAMFLRCGES